MQRAEVKQVLRTRVFDVLGPAGINRGDRDGAAKEIQRALKRLRVKLSAPEQVALVKEVVDDLFGFGPLQPLFDDASVAEIMVNGPSKVFFERDGRQHRADARFDSDRHLRETIERMARTCNQRIDETKPFADMTLPDGTRVNAVYPPMSADGPLLTARKRLKQVSNLENLVVKGTMNAAMAEMLKHAVLGRLNILLSGATSSGKTTLMGLLAQQIPDDERIVTLEDTPELQLSQSNVARLLTRGANLEGQGEITLRELFSNSLRMRPERILLGEIRGGEAFEFLQAMTSGHRGAMAVIHASNPEEAILRLENLVYMSGMSVPSQAIRSQIVHGIDLVIQLHLHPDGHRRITRVTEVLGLDGHGMVSVADLFTYEATAVGPDGTWVGRFRPSGVPPRRPACAAAGLAHFTGG